MASKCLQKDSEGSVIITRRVKNVMPLECKMKILEELTDGKSNCAVARQFGVNESTIRSIKKSEGAIRASVASGVETSLKFSCMPRDSAIEKMEKALNIWMHGQSQNETSVSTLLIRNKARQIYRTLAKNSGADPNKFLASKGWCDNYKKRYCQRNVKSARRISLTQTGVEWGNILREVVNDSSEIPTVGDEISHILKSVKCVNGDELNDMEPDEDHGFPFSQSHNLKLEVIQESVASSSNEEDNERMDREHKMLIALDNVNELMAIASDITGKALEIDPFMERSLNFKRILDVALKPYRKLQNDLRSRNLQAEFLTIFQNPGKPILDDPGQIMSFQDHR